MAWLALLAFIGWSPWSAVTTAKADAQGISFRSGGWYTFYFPIKLFDRAVCDVAVDANGVVTRSSSVQYD
jgi:hypothetical protein